jgi:hypothetical protein
MITRDPLRQKSFSFLPLRRADDGMCRHADWSRLLLEEESCAAEAYRHALAAGSLASATEPLRELLADHDLAARSLSDCMEDEKFPTGVRAVWSELTRALDVEARVCARRSVLWTLRDAEVLAAQQYRGCLDRDVLSPSCANLVRGRLLPKAHEHVLVLEGLIALAEEEVELVP